MNPLVSVVIPTYGRPEYLSRAIESIYNQTYPKVEIIVVDDCSPTPVDGNIPQYDDNLKILRHKQNKGVSEARNTGIDAADGQFIAFLDDDDYWKPGKLSLQIEQISNGNFEASYTGYETVNTSGKIITKKTPTLNGDISSKIVCSNPISISSVVVSSDVLKSTNGFDSTLPSWEDWEWLIRLSLQAEFGVVKKPLTVHQRGEEHNQRSKLTDNKPKGCGIFLDKVNTIVEESVDVPMSKVEACAYYELGRYMLSNGHSREAQKSFKKSIHRYPYLTLPYAYFVLSLLGFRLYRNMRILKRKIWISRVSQ